jgi:glyoxylase-like metal-dependent hydrolase (beta-lactamase superfamily II)
MGRFLFKFFLFLLIVAALGVGALQLARRMADPPQPVRGTVVRVRNLFVDLYAAHNGTRVMLFDAGADPWGKALDTLLGNTSRDQVTDVFLTHGHPDHVAGATLCARARVHAGKGDVDMVESPVETDPFPAKLVSFMLPRPGGKVSDPLAGEAEIAVGGGATVRAIPLPGHTGGSYAYLWESVLFVGDSLQYKEGRLDFAQPAFSEDPDENRRSIAALRDGLHGARVESVCTGHFGCTPLAETKKLLDDLIKRAGTK